MKKFYLLSFIISFIITIILVYLAYYIKEGIWIEIIIGSLISFIIVVFSNLSLWIFYRNKDKKEIKLKLLELLNLLGELYSVVAYSTKNINQTTIPGFYKTIELYIKFSSRVQDFYKEIVYENYPDYYDIYDEVKEIVKEIKRISNNHSVIKTDLEKLNAYKSIISFTTDDNCVEEFILKIKDLQSEKIVQLNEETYKKSKTNE